MEKDLIVAIFATVTGKMTDGVFGTGYPVTEDLILTSRHVIAPEPENRRAQISVKWFYDCPANGKSPVWTTIKKADLVWAGEGDLDAALICCHKPEYLRRFRHGRLAPRMPAKGEPWESSGFAAANQRGKIREPGHFGGTLRSMAEGEPFFELIEEAQPDKAPQSIAESQWGGVSGMPVFVGGDILGVIRQIPPNYNNKKLQAVPAWRLLEDDDFKKALGLDEEGERLERTRQLLRRLLARSDVVTRDLAKALDLNSSSGDILKCRQQVVERLLTGTPLERLFELALAVQAKQRGKKDQAGARVAADLMLTILPAIHDVAVVSKVRRRKGDTAECIISLPTELRTLAELIMAGTDRRMALLRPMPTKDYFPEGVPSLPEPPECGRDPDGKQFGRDWRADLLNTFGADLDGFEGDFRDYLKERFIQSDQRSTGAEKRLTEAVAEELRYQAEEEHLTYYFIAEMHTDPKARQEQETVLAKLKKDFPAISFLRLAGGEGLAAERRRYRKLCKLLYEDPELDA
jgi:hypothetical protein